MITTRCLCGNRLFFGNRQCLQCGSEVRFCPTCQTTTNVDVDADGTLVCHNASCKKPMKPCENSTQLAVCNGAVSITEANESLCAHCRLNAVIPNVDVEANVKLWRLMEDAKRRVLEGMRLAGLDVVASDAGQQLPLRFEFRSDQQGAVSTGHANGVITLRLEEADSAERERVRNNFGEPKRTLTAHFRHELGHYVWQRTVETNRIDDFRAVFGDESNPTYQDAKDAYYKNGTDPDWSSNYVSEYASMHPWEDFAESFRVFLEIDAMLKTGHAFDLAEEQSRSFDDRISQFFPLAIACNELNREIGVTDLVPEKFPQPVIEKLRFIDSLTTAS